MAITYKQISLKNKIHYQFKII